MKRATPPSPAAVEARALDILLQELLDLETEARERRLTELPVAQRETLRALLSAALDEDDFLQPGQALSPGLIDQALADAGESLAPGSELGPWRVLQQIGAGGMGRVYLAERADGLFERRVAIKLVHAEPGLASIERLQREQRILAGLEHPNIARLHDAGLSPGGSPYLVMEHVEGETIDAWCRRLALDARQCLHLVVEVCEAVQAAHQRLVVHRDIKPTNILVDADGRVKLLDFGIAHFLDNEDATTNATATVAEPGQAITQTQGRAWLTPRYASPEQRAGASVTTASDVYQLGLLAWELLSETVPPIDRGTPLTELPTTAARRAHAAGLPPADLNAVLARALAPDPAARYPSADRLREDLQRLLEGHAVAARAATVGYRARRFLARHRAGTAAVVVALLALIAGMLGTVWQAREAAIQAERALAEARRASAVRDFLAEVLRSAKPSRGEIPDALDILNAGSSRARAELMQRDPMAAGDVLTVTGAARYNLSDFDAALADLEDAHAAFARVDPAPAEALSRLHWEWGRLLRVRGPGRDAGEHYRQSIHWAEVAGMPAAWIWGRRASLAAWHMEYDDPAEAERGLLALIEAADGVGATVGDRLIALNALTTAMALLRRDPDLQLEWQERRLLVAAEAYGELDGWTAFTLADVIPTFRNAGRPARALELGARAVAIADQIYSQPDALGIVAYCNQASMFRHLGRNAEALELYRRFAEMERSLQRANLHAESCWSGYAEVLLVHGELDLALDAVGQAAATLDRMNVDRPLHRLNQCALAARGKRRGGDIEAARSHLVACTDALNPATTDTALLYRLERARLALLAGDIAAADDLAVLRERQRPSVGSILWLDVWLPSLWLERKGADGANAQAIEASIRTGLERIAAPWEGQDMVQRCLVPTSSLADCMERY